MMAEWQQSSKAGRRRRIGLAAVGVAALTLAVPIVVMVCSPLRYAIPAAPVIGMFPAAIAAACLGGLAVAASRRPGRLTRMLAAVGAISATAMLPVLATAGFVRPYDIKRFETGSTGDVTIAGEALVPEGHGPFPAVVIVPGSAGEQPVTRDSQFGLYRANAEVLARRGVVAAIYDKRGAGKSTGDRGAALLQDHAEDAAAVARWLRRQPYADAARVGFWGISNGGWVAPLAAQRCGETPFVIVVSAPATSEGRQRQYEWSRSLQSQGVERRVIDDLLKARWTIWRFLATGEQYDAAAAAYRSAKSRPGWKHLDHVIFPRWLDRDYVQDPEHAEEFAWFRSDMVRDPMEVLSSQPSRVLALYGGQDEVIPVVSAIEFMRTFAAAQPGRMKVVVYPGYGHPLVKLGLPPRFPPGYADEMIEWIRASGD